MTPCFRQAVNSSTAPFMTPWSVSASAGWSNAAARSASASILQAPSSSEYSEWTWRCAQAGLIDRSPSIGIAADDQGRLSCVSAGICADRGSGHARGLSGSLAQEPDDGVAFLAATLPHFAYHLTTTGNFSAADNPGSLGGLVVELALLSGATLVALRRPG